MPIHRHPILRLEVLAPDGTRQTAYRVFCRQRNESVPVGTCCACMHCVGITNEPRPTVDCTIFVSDEPDPLGDTTSVGALLRHGGCVLDQSCSTQDAYSEIQVAEDYIRVIGIVDTEKKIVGIIHDSDWVRDHNRFPVRETMSSSLAVHEATPIRKALRLLASGHMREVVVIDSEGHPIGTFRDVDGLAWLAAQKRPLSER